VKKPKVVHLIDHTDSGGAQVVILNLIRALKGDLSFSVANLGISGRFTQNYEALGVPVFQLGNRLGRWEPFSLIKLTKFVRRYKIDLIHAHLFKSVIFAPLAGKLNGCKVIIHDHSGIYPEALQHHFHNRFVRSAYLNAFRISLLFSDNVVVLTPLMERYYAEHYRAFQHKITVVPNFVDFDKFINHDVLQNNDLRKELLIPQGTKLIIMIGRLEKNKDWPTFLQIAKCFHGIDKPKCHFLVVGSGSLQFQLEKISRDLSLENVSFLGYRTDVFSLLQQSDVFLLTSRHEPFGIVVLEAMAAGCPVVATRSGGPDSYIQHRVNGLLVDVGDVEGMKNHIIELVNDGELARNLVVNAKDIVSLKYSLNSISDQIRHIYDHII
jgi:glycosyltransferase involved in cell wall biosynthesis